MADFGGFDHNHQSLRIVEELEHRFPDFFGLNLSWEVREGIMKHESEYDRGAAFAFDPDRRGTLECQIVNAADEIAYSTADLDDGFRSGMITPDQLSDVTLWNEVIEELGIDFCAGLSDMDRHRIIRRLVGKEVTDLIQATSELLQTSDIQTVDDLRDLPINVVTHSEAMQARNRELKNFLYQNLYRHWRVMRMASKAHRFLTQLFQLFVAEPTLLPWQTQARSETETLQRVVCDYVAGMTDRYALQEYQKLFDPIERV
jgi:dGTPase